jgi:hypothetical protein
MLSNKEQKERKFRIIALAGTILFHAILVFALFKFAFFTSISLSDEVGIEIDPAFSTDSIFEIHFGVPAKTTDTVAFIKQK